MIANCINVSTLTRGARLDFPPGVSDADFGIRSCTARALSSPNITTLFRSCPINVTRIQFALHSSQLTEFLDRARSHLDSRFIARDSYVSIPLSDLDVKEASDLSQVLITWAKESKDLVRISDR